MAGQGQKDITHNEAVITMDCLVNPVAVSRQLASPPENPAAGQCWLVPAFPEGDWASFGDHLASWTIGGWRFSPTVPGMSIWVLDEQLAIRKVEDGWASQAPLGCPWPSVEAPTGGDVVDLEARAALDLLLARLTDMGLFKATAT